MKPGSVIYAGKEIPAKRTGQMSLLICGIIAPLLFIVTDIAAGTLWKGYSFISQSISELSAFGAPTRPMVVALNLIYYVLLGTFGIGVWRAAGQNRLLLVIAALLEGTIVFNLAAEFFPLNSAELMSSYSNSMNVILKGTSVMLFLLAVGFGAAAFRNWFRFYSAGTLLAFLILTILGIYVFPYIGFPQPVSRVGAQERVMVFGFLVWAAVLANVLLRSEKDMIKKPNEKSGKADIK
jgi:hypothetical protein